MGEIKNLKKILFVSVLIVIGVFGLPAQAKYGGGTGEPNDPYLIYTAEQMNEIGLSVNSDDWDKHFRLMADIDLSGYTGTSFNLIGYYIDYLNKKAFTGVFDGGNHSISNFTYESNDISNIGLFGCVDNANALIKDLGLINPNIDAGTGSCVGSLVGWLFIGNISGCCVNGGSVSGSNYVGGIVGKSATFSPPITPSNVTNCHAIVDVRGDGDSIGGIMGGSYYGRISACHAAGNTFSSGNAVGGLVGLLQWGTISNSHADVTVVGSNGTGGLVGISTGGSSVITSSSIGSVEGANAVGGLVGSNSSGLISDCYATGSVDGTNVVGGLVGNNHYSGRITNCYSAGSVKGTMVVAGLLGVNGNSPSHTATVSNCYATGSIVGANDVGGLIGTNEYGTVMSSFWDIDTSGLNNMCGGQGPDGSGCDNANGKTTGQMQTESTFTEAGWDFVGETANGTEDIWKKSDGPYYPRLSWEKYWEGTGEPNDPYLIYNAIQMNAIGANPNDWDKHFLLCADIDMSAFTGTEFNIISTSSNPFTGTFDGNRKTISNFTYGPTDADYVGLFAYVDKESAQIKDLGLINSNISTTGMRVGCFVGRLGEGNISGCYADGGSISGGDFYIGGLVGTHYGSGMISNCYTSVEISGGECIGGLVGQNGSASRTLYCYSNSNVSANVYAGGLIGVNNGWISNCYSGGAISINNRAGGLVSVNDGTILNCYSTGQLSVEGDFIGGLVGNNYSGGTIIASFWDIETSGRNNSDGGMGKTTAEMQDPKTFLEAGWDFDGESVNGTQNIWRLCEDTVDYPRFSWEFIPADFVCPDGVEMRDFAILGAQWLQPPGEPSADIAPNSGNGIVDRFDLAELVDNWLTECKVLLPGQASNPNPPDGAGIADFNADLRWTAGTRATSHDVYFGTTNTPPFVCNQTAVTFDPGKMGYSTTYYWRIDEVGPYTTTKGTVWSFTIIPPPPPT